MHPYYGQPIGQPIGPPIGQPLMTHPLQQMWRPINNANTSSNQTQVIVPNFVIQTRPTQRSRSPTPVPLQTRGRDPTPKWMQTTHPKQIIGANESALNMRENAMWNSRQPDMEVMQRNMNVHQIRRPPSPVAVSLNRSNQKMAPQRPPPPNMSQDYIQNFDPNAYSSMVDNQRSHSPMMMSSMNRIPDTRVDNRRSGSPMPMASRNLMPNPMMDNQRSAQMNSIPNQMISAQQNLMPNSMLQNRSQMQMPSGNLTSNASIRRSSSPMGSRNLTSNQTAATRRSPSPVPMYKRTIVLDKMNPSSDPNAFWNNQMNPQMNSQNFLQPMDNKMLSTQQSNNLLMPPEINNSSRHSSSPSPKTNQNLLHPGLGFNKSLSSHSLNTSNRLSPSPVKTQTINQSLTQQTLSPNRISRSSSSSFSSRKGSLYGTPTNVETLGDHFDHYRSTTPKSNRFSDDFDDLNLNFNMNFGKFLTNFPTEKLLTFM